jgi:predicted metal-dependent HD superfamily phosphohydrolase
LLDGARHLAQRPDEVEAALWLHDVVYDPHARDNEAQSARWAMDRLQAAGVPVERAQYVGDLILATRHDEASPRSNALPDAVLVADIDLAILGAKREQYDRYEVQIRQEYDWVPEDAFREGRADVLRRFLQRATIFQTALFQARYEDRARANLRRSLRQLGTE